MKSVLVTGVNGFCGRYLVPTLRDRGVRVLGVGRADGPAVTMDGYFKGDLFEPDFVQNLIQQSQPNVVINLAGRYQGTEDELHTAHLQLPNTILKAVANVSKRVRVILIGSAAEYGPSDCLSPLTESSLCAPVTHYGKSKLAMTEAALSSIERLGLSVVVVRPFNILGVGLSSQLFVSAILSRLQRAMNEGPNPTIQVGNLHVRRDFIDVDDVVEAYTRLALDNETSGLYNCCSGEAVQLTDILELIREITGVDFKTEVDPALVRAGESSCIFGSYKLLTAETGWSPKIPLELSIRQMCQRITPRAGIA